MPGEPATRKGLFISHVSDETGVAQWLKARLDADLLGALDIFVSSDRSTIDAGSRWLEEVHQALDRADLQIVLCSRESVGRPWVNFEAGAVWLRGIPMIPVCHSGLRPENLPVPFSLQQAVTLTDRDGLQTLYDKVASTLGLRTPAVDFASMASEAAQIEADLGRRVRIETVADPRVLCAASEGHAQYDFDLDVAVLEACFPGRVTVERSLTSRSLREMLTTERFDLVHLVTGVDRATASLVFDTAGDGGTGRPDVMRVPGLASLLQRAGTRLLVLATCNVGLVMSVELAGHLNVAVADGDLSGQEAADWADCFYSLLAQGTPVHESFDITATQNEVPIRGLKQKDVVFSRGA